MHNCALQLDKHNTTGLRTHMLFKKIRAPFFLKQGLIVLGLLWFSHCSITFAENNIQHKTQESLHKHGATKKISPKKNNTKNSHLAKTKKLNHANKKNLKSKKHFKSVPKTYAHLNRHLEASCSKAFELTNTSTSLTGSIEQHLVNFVHTVVATLHYSAYKLGGTHFDVSRGVYIVDCSDYVNHLLQFVYPDAYSDLLDSIGSDKPTSQLYYNFFSGLSEDPNHYWTKLDDPEKLQAGDIIVFRNKARGHVMVVMDKPIHDNDVLLVRITDSAPSAHSEDTRTPNDSGIGIGTLLLKVNSHTRHLAAYAWKEGAHWESHVNFAMARPLDVG